MTSEVVSFRLRKEDVDRLRRKGKNPNSFAKQAAEEALRRLDIDEALDRLERSGFSLADDSVDIIRRERASH